MDLKDLTLDEARRIVREKEATRRKQIAAQKARRSLEAQAVKLVKAQAEPDELTPCPPDLGGAQ